MPDSAPINAPAAVPAVPPVRPVRERSPMNASPVRAQDKTQSPPSAPAEPIDIQKIKFSDDFVTLNFTNIDISALVKVMSELSRRNFILDERVTGKLTIMTPTRISPDEAYQVFLSALEIKGFTAIEDGKIIRIIPSAMARQSGLKVFQDGSLRGEGFATRLVRLNYVNPQEIVRIITPLMTKDGNLIAYHATNSIIMTDSASNMRKIDSLIRVMDVPAPEGKGKINVYYLRNANAEDIGKLMQALVSRLPSPSAGGVQPAGPSTILEGAVTITADKATNSLIIVASPGDYETMKDVIQKLDIRRRQVYVEAAIIEMSLAKQREFGFEFQATNLNQLSNNKTSAIGGTNFGNIGNVMAGGPTALASLSGLNVAAVKGTFTFKGVEFLNIGALLHALQTDTDINVLSTPNILTTDNQKATIMVGENVPFITGQTQNAATGGTAIQTTVERKDVGITLELTPQITSDDNVRLEIKQEISAVTETAGLDPNKVGPTTSKRTASTTVVVKDRQTMVIGGLIRDNLTSTTSKVPLLGDIPLLGWLFKFKSSKVEKTNLMIFITPYIIKTEADSGELTNKKNDTLEQFRKEYHIEKKSEVPAFRPNAGVSAQPESAAAPAPVVEKPAPKKKDAPGALKNGPTNTAGTPDAGPMLKSTPTTTTAPVPQGGAR